ncbi:MAG: hypothetical protein J5859_06525 [Clostridia bacterium]|nr:hypothetical protein [Clostridia bacterium]
MKLTFLGTGAGEGYPGLWCNCPHCSYARLHGGRNIRANSCAVLDGKLLLDMGPACFDNAARFGVDITGAQALLVTHPHEDHLYPQHFIWRRTSQETLALGYREQMFRGGPCFTPVPELTIYGNSFTKALLAPYKDRAGNLGLRFEEIHEGEAFDAAGCHVTPVRGNHHERGFAHSYVIEKDGKTLLYALDSGMYDADMMDLLRSFRYDLVVMEGTTGLNEQYGGHMCLVTDLKMKEFLKENGCLNEGCPFVLTHMSPHWCPPHDWYEAVVQRSGITLAYDGLSIEI